MHDDPLAPTPLEDARKSQQAQTTKQDQIDSDTTKSNSMRYPEVTTIVSRFEPTSPPTEQSEEIEITPRSSAKSSPETLRDTVRAELELREQQSEDLKRRHSEANERWKAERQVTEQAHSLETEKLRIRGKTLDQDFQSALEHSSPSPEKEKADREKSTNFRQTSIAQVVIEQDRDREMFRHDARWRMHEQRLAAQSLPAPAPPTGVVEQQSVKEKYMEARRQWESQRDGINEKYDSEQVIARDQGVTLADLYQNEVDIGPDNASGEFSQTEVPDTEPGRAENLRSERISTEFSISASDGPEASYAEPEPAPPVEVQPQPEAQMEPAPMNYEMNEPVPQVQDIAPSHDAGTVDNEPSQGHEM
jgi:hypothetical protein